MEMEEISEKVNGLVEQVARLTAELEKLRVEREGGQKGVPTMPKQDRGDRKDKQDDSDIHEDVATHLTLLAKRRAMAHFVLDLELLVYEDNPDEMRIPVDRRLNQTKVDFVRERFLERFEVPDRANELMWKSMKEVLNRRVYRKRMALKKKAAEQKEKAEEQGKSDEEEKVY
ncbi:hypothetical protein OSTOST_09127 [Ostertagia ostertagi]